MHVFHQLSPEEVGTKVTAVDTVVVETKLLRTITIDAPKIIEKRNEVANSYVSLANKVHPTQTDINESLQQITKTLYALGELNFTTNPTCVEGPFGNVCDSNESEPQTTIDDDNPFSNPVEANPSLGRPVRRPIKKVQAQIVKSMNKKA